MDSATFKEEVLIHYKVMYRVALSIVKNSDDAQDIVQDAISRLWEKRNTISDINNYQAFCLTVVKRQCIDFFRANPDRNQPIEEQSQLTSDNDTETTIENRDNFNYITRLMKLLPKQQRQVLELRSFGNCTMEEIEEATGLSDANVRTLLSRARKKLKELYLNSKDD